MGVEHIGNRTGGEFEGNSIIAKNGLVSLETQDPATADSAAVKELELQWHGNSVADDESVGAVKTQCARADYLRAAFQGQVACRAIVLKLEARAILHLQSAGDPQPATINKARIATGGQLETPGGSNVNGQSDTGFSTVVASHSDAEIHHAFVYYLACASKGRGVVVGYLPEDAAIG